MKNNEYNRITINRWLRKWRTTHGLTQGEIAATIGVNINSYQSWERGYNHPKQENFDKLMAFVNEHADNKPPKQNNW